MSDRLAHAVAVSSDAVDVSCVKLEISDMLAVTVAVKLACSTAEPAIRDTRLPTCPAI